MLEAKEGRSENFQSFPSLFIPPINLNIWIIYPQLITAKERSIIVIILRVAMTIIIRESFFYYLLI